MSEESEERHTPSPPLEPLSARVLKNAFEVEEVRRVWESWPGHRDADIDFYLTIVRSRPEVLRPHVLVLSRGKVPQAMLIGRLEHRKIDFRLGYMSICKPKVRVLSFVAGGLRGDHSPDSSGFFVNEILKALREGQSDVAILSFVDVTSSLYELARNLPGALSRDHLPRVNTHWRMQLPETVEDVYRGFSKNLRGQLRRKTRKLLAAFGERTRVGNFRDVAQVEQMMNEVEEVAKKTYQRGIGVGFSMSEEMRDRLFLQAVKGWLRAYVLYIDEKPCAFWVGSLYGGVFYSDYLAHDPAYDKFSVGTFLTLRAIESLCQEGAAQVDFGPGDSRYKQELGNSKCKETTIHIFAPSFAGYRLNALHSSLALADRFARTCLGHGNVLPRIRRTWRDRSR